MAERTARFRFSVDIDELIAKAKRGEDVFLKLGDAGEKAGGKVKVGMDNASQATQRAGDNATAASVRFQTLTQGMLNLSTATAQTYTSISNLTRVQISAQMAAVNHERSLVLLRQQEFRLAQERDKAAPNLEKIAILEQKIAVERENVKVKAQQLAYAQDQMNDVYILFGTSIANTVVSSLQTIKSMKDLQVAATLRSVFAINAETASLTGNTAATAVNTGFLSKYVIAVGSATAGTRALTFANHQLAFSIRGVQIALGPIGLALIGFSTAWALIEANVGGSKDALTEFLGIKDRFDVSNESKDVEDFANNFNQLSKAMDGTGKSMERNQQIIRKMTADYIDNLEAQANSIAEVIALENTRNKLLQAQGFPFPGKTGVPTTEEIRDDIIEEEDHGIPSWIPTASGAVVDPTMIPGIPKQKFPPKTGKYVQDKNGVVTFYPAGSTQGFTFTPLHTTRELSDVQKSIREKVLSEIGILIQNERLFGPIDVSPIDELQRIRDLIAAERSIIGSNLSFPSRVGGGFKLGTEGGIFGQEFVAGTKGFRRNLRIRQLINRLGLEGDDMIAVAEEILENASKLAAEEMKEIYTDPQKRRAFIKKHTGFDIGAVAGVIPVSEAIRIANLESRIASMPSRGGFDIAGQILGGNATQAFQIQDFTGSGNIRAVGRIGGGFDFVPIGTRMGGIERDTGGASLTPAHIIQEARIRDSEINTARRRQREEGKRLLQSQMNVLRRVGIGFRSTSQAVFHITSLQRQMDQLAGLALEVGIPFTPDFSPKVIRGLDLLSTQIETAQVQKFDIPFGQPLGLTRGEVKSVFFDPLRGQGELEDRIRFNQRNLSMSTGTMI